MSKHVPTYRKKRTPSGTYAVVTLPDPSGKRHDILLGHYGTEASRTEYRRVLAEWDASGRLTKRSGAKDLTVNELTLAYWEHVRKCHQSRAEKREIAARGSDGEVHSLKSALRVIKELYGFTMVGDFGPLSLKAVRDKMIQSKGRSGRPWSRSFINASIGRIKSMFKWAVENEMIKPTILHGLQAVRGLLWGQTAARETDPVKPVPTAAVEATLAYSLRPVAAMVRLQLLTAMRPGEVVVMRACDLNTSGRIWFYSPPYHKTQWRGHRRAIAIGPQGQAIIKEFLTRNTQAFLFSPRQSVEERRQAIRLRRKTKVQPSQVDRRKKNPKRKAGECYTVGTYRNAIRRACAMADAAAHRERPDVPVDQRIIPNWAPNQLRHARATELRKEYGLDAARVILGHRSPLISEVYAELDASAAERIMSAIG
jgi:integrase